MSGRLDTITEAHDTCFRCGKPTPLGVPLCEHDNPGRIKGPSTTQVHGTIVIGLIVGFILFGLAATMIRAGGPFDAAIVATTPVGDGQTSVVVNVTNEGDRSARATCRLSQGGLVGSGDDVFFSEPIPAGEMRQFTRLLRAANAPAGRPLQVAVLCN
ncbi:MAG TPA: hypothetical protein VNT28_09030 [Candidatus Limnocylindrales bacterium]|jgi:hypothetical protein|nr:hypothetical protein [Candidatus Limnocylindrales bacterium]